MPTPTNSSRKNVRRSTQLDAVRAYPLPELDRMGMRVPPSPASISLSWSPLLPPLASRLPARLPFMLWWLDMASAA